MNNEAPHEVQRKLNNAAQLVKYLDNQKSWTQFALDTKKKLRDELNAEIEILENEVDECTTQSKYWQGYITDNTDQKGGVSNGNGTGA